MPTLHAILIDDEVSSMSALHEKLARHCPEISVLQLCDSAAAGIEAIGRWQPDVVFLDIEMPVMNGFTMLQQIRHRNFDLIFVTAWDHYAIKAIRFSALDYLLKPVDPADLKAAVQRVVEKQWYTGMSNPRIELLLENMAAEKKRFRKLALPTLDGLQFVRLDDVLYLEANVNYTHFYLADKRKLTVSKTLKDFEEILPAEQFFRIHNSHIINKDHIEKYIRGEGGQVVLANGAVLDVSKRKKQEFLKAIGY